MMRHIDIHTHILPSLDDGPTAVADALELARQFVRNDTDRIFATPHGFSTVYHADPEVSQAALTRFSKEVRRAGIDLTVRLGMEIHYHPRVVQTILEGRALCLGSADTQRRYALIELPARDWPTELPEVIYELALREIQTIIAHPERNLAALAREQLIDEALAEGAWLQLTAGSLTGQFGSACERLSRRWLDAGKVHVIASDAHDPRVRQAGLARAFARLDEWGLSSAGEQCRRNAETIWRMTT